MQLWGPESLTMCCSWTARKSCGRIQSKGNSLRARRAHGISLSPRSKTQESGSRWFKSGSPKGKNQQLWCPRTEDGCPSSREKIFTLLLPLSSLQAPSGVDDAHLHWWGLISLLSQLNPMVIFPRHILTDTPRNNGLPATWTSLRTVKFTHKINHHTPTWESESNFRIHTFMPLLTHSANMV